MSEPSDGRLVAAARALLDWTQRDLAKASNVSMSTLVKFEHSKTKLQQNNYLAVLAALRAAGVRFTPNGVYLFKELSTAELRDRDSRERYNYDRERKDAEEVRSDPGQAEVQGRPHG